MFLEARGGSEFIGSTAIDGLRATTIQSLRAMMHKHLDKPLPKFQFLGSTGKPIDDEQVGPARDPASFHGKEHKQTHPQVLIRPVSTDPELIVPLRSWEGKRALFCITLDTAHDSYHSAYHHLCLPIRHGLCRICSRRPQLRPPGPQPSFYLYSRAEVVNNPGRSRGRPPLDPRMLGVVVAAAVVASPPTPAHTSRTSGPNDIVASSAISSTRREPRLAW